MDKEDAIRVDSDNREFIWYTKIINYRLDGFFKSTEDLIFSNKQALKNIEEFHRRTTLTAETKQHASRKEQDLEEDNGGRPGGISSSWLKLIIDSVIKAVGSFTKNKSKANDKGDAAKIDDDIDPSELVYRSDKDIEFTADEIVFESDAEFSSSPQMMGVDPQEIIGQIGQAEQQQNEQQTPDKHEQVTKPEQQSSEQETQQPLEVEISKPASRSILPSETPNYSETPEHVTTETSSVPTTPIRPEDGLVRKHPVKQDASRIENIVEKESEPSSIDAAESRDREDPADLSLGSRSLTEDKEIPAKPESQNQSANIKPSVMELPSDVRPDHDVAPQSQPSEQRSVPKSQKIDESPVSRFQFIQPETRDIIGKRLDATPMSHNRLQFRSIEPTAETMPTSSQSMQQSFQQLGNEPTNTKGNSHIGKKIKKITHVAPPMITGDIGKKKWLGAPSIVSPSHNRRGDFGVTGDLI